MEAALVSYAEGSVKTVLGKLGSLLANEAIKLYGVRDEIQGLKDELQSMNAFLQNHARTEDHNSQVKTWMLQVRELAYDTEDCIDVFMRHIGGPIEGGLLLRCLRRGIRLLRTLKARHGIASNIQSLKTRVHSVSERHSRYAHLVPTSEIGGSISSSIDPRLPTFFPKQGEVVGIMDRTNMIIERLLDDNVRDLRVISIVGYGGLGKTTLAMTAYEDPKVKNGHFQCRAQISVSQKFNFNELLRDILKQVFPSTWEGQVTKGEKMNKNPLENIENWSDKKLIMELKGHLENNKYFMVIDDIWAMSAWDSIKCVLPDKKNGSRVIITTRINSVAELCSYPHDDHVHQIKPLDPIQSKKLFNQKVFGSLNSCPNELETVCGNILSKCGGMPLVIVSIAGLLSVKPNQNKQEWQKVCDSLGYELEANPSLEGIKKILYLSYNDLPFHLKTCFLYLSIFPEDYKIGRKKLMRRWVAEGFVSGKRGLSEEHVAQSYFDELLNRNLIQAVDFTIDGRVKTCRIHDIILELIVSKSVEENFVSLVEDQYTVVFCDKIRRLSVQSSKQNFTNFGLSNIRSLSFYGRAYKSFSLSSFRVLRVLDLENSVIKDNHLNNIGKLFLLKYLSLRRNIELTKLPAEIGKLQHLETLDIKHTCITQLPKGASNLRSLKHLASWFNHLNISGMYLENMRNLETLTGVESLMNSPKSLEKCKHIKKLGVDSDRKEELLNLELSPDLYNLKLSCLDVSIPKCIDSLRYLVKLSLNCVILSDDDMKKLGELPRLVYLDLEHFSVISEQENKLIFRRDLFIPIKLLKIICPETQVIFEEATAPNLERLECFFSFHYETEPVIGMENLGKLKEIQVEHWYKERPSIMDKLKEQAKANTNHPNFIEIDRMQSKPESESVPQDSNSRSAELDKNPSNRMENPELAESSNSDSIRVELETGKGKGPAK